MVSRAFQVVILPPFSQDSCSSLYISMQNLRSSRIIVLRNFPHFPSLFPSIQSTPICDPHLPDIYHSRSLSFLTFPILAFSIQTPSGYVFERCDNLYRYWKTISFFAPLLGATLVAGYLVKDHHHSSYDVVAGGIIGASIGYAHFRTSYFGVWDYRVNHIPLPREGFPLLGEELA